MWSAWMTTWWRIGYGEAQRAGLTGAYVMRGGRRVWSVP